ncbi:hypothetical protein SAMN04487869_11150 [Marinobacter sp. DSM 26671]|jgi:hypothetical protein|uniref:DUF6160 family protein n=2 Tax=unclassified Marinobacter TaxID=83889 RepID=UPI0008E39F64|nr:MULTISPECIES: DUF6160 family protein [unclassified Marinobacter]MAK48928.1 hypothetical protein [Marinobacter sp.]MAM52130.1 hypothetical protein [Marinobacter sp.]MTI78581.1 hypothetical protein [Marinobacter sp.]SFE60344.1 hypothetical protein SAMN04487869_11150 [Marinobacter sp. DSM 26671]|tara:strand:+ start:1143 stop:2105 length:963 start_codon:yes stop_codon:yes gene_type:complete
MKGLKKIALATAVAAAPFAAQAELTAMNDSAMGNVTGQAGVTIELETQVSIGQFKYTDTNGGAAGEIGGGSFTVNDIELGGAGLITGANPIFDTNSDGTPDTAASQLLDDLSIDIDLADDGDAVISVHTISGLPIDWGFTASSMNLEGTDSTTLISGLSAWGMLAKLDIRVDTEDASTSLGGTGDGSLNIDTAFTVNNMEFDVPFLAVGVRGMSITGAGANFDYNGDGVVDSADTDLDGSGTVGDTKAERINVGFAKVNLDVYKGNGLGQSTATDVLRVDVNDVVMDVNVGGVLIGGTSIGTVALDNLHIQNTRLAVYGH